MTNRPSLFARLVGLTPAALVTIEPDSEAQRRDLEALMNAFEETMTLLTEALAAGTITVAQFASRGRAEIRRLHLAAAVIGSGGSERATPQTRALAQQQISAQLVYFDQWVEQLKAEQNLKRDLALAGVAALALVSRKRAATAFVRTSQAALSARARSYGGAAVETQTRANVGSRGLPQLPFQPGYRTRCRGNCRCDWRIVPLGNDDFDCYWTLGVAEHCPTCLARSRAANPLRVRGGEIQNPARYTAGSLYA